jgi:hypothetical protein
MRLVFIELAGWLEDESLRRCPPPEDEIGHYPSILRIESILPLQFFANALEQPDWGSGCGGRARMGHSPEQIQETFAKARLRRDFVTRPKDCAQSGGSACFLTGAIRLRGAIIPSYK